MPKRFDGGGDDRMAFFRERKPDQRDALAGHGVLRRILLLANLANRGFHRTVELELDFARMDTPKVEDGGRGIFSTNPSAT